MMLNDRERLHYQILKLTRLVDEQDNVIKDLRKELAQYKKYYSNRNTWAE